jgi:hypothetical protein
VLALASGVLIVALVVSGFALDHGQPQHQDYSSILDHGDAAVKTSPSGAMKWVTIGAPLV